MDNAQRLVTAVTIARRCVAAAGRGARPGDDDADGAVLADVTAFAGRDLDTGLLSRTRERLSEPVLSPSDRVDLLVQWTWPIHTAMLAGRPLPTALEEMRQEVETETRNHGGTVTDLLDDLDGQAFASTAVRMAGEAQRRGEWDESGDWLRLARASGRLPREPGSPGKRLAVVGAALLIPVALAVWLVARSGGGGPDTPPLPYSPIDLASACDGKAFPAATGYAGAAPHDTVVVTTAGGTTGSSSKKWVPLDTVNSGSDVMKFSRAWRPDETRKVQAVACVTVTSQPGIVDECHYRSSRDLIQTSMPQQIFMYKGRFTITVVEARSARPLHRVEVTGEKADCPRTLPADTVSTHTDLTADQLKTAIGHLIDG